MSPAKNLELKPDNVALLAYPPNFDLLFANILTGKKVTVYLPDSINLYGYEFKALTPPLSVGKTGVINATAQQVSLHYDEDPVDSPEFQEKLRRYEEAPTYRKILMILRGIID